MAQRNPKVSSTATPIADPQATSQLKKPDQQEDGSESDDRQAERASTQPGPRQREGAGGIRWGETEKVTSWRSIGASMAEIFARDPASACRPDFSLLRLAHRSSVWMGSKGLVTHRSG